MEWPSKTARLILSFFMTAWRSLQRQSTEIFFGFFGAADFPWPRQSNITTWRFFLKEAWRCFQKNVEQPSPLQNTRGFSDFPTEEYQIWVPSKLRTNPSSTFFDLVLIAVEVECVFFNVFKWFGCLFLCPIKEGRLLVYSWSVCQTSLVGTSVLTPTVVTS